MARLASNDRQSFSSGYGPSYSSGGSTSKFAAAMFLGFVGLLIGLAIAGLLWTVSWVLHWAFAWDIGRTLMASRGWWIGWPAGVALAGAVIGLCAGD